MITNLSEVESNSISFDDSTHRIETIISVEEFFNIWQDRVGIFVRHVVLDNFAFAVDEEFSEIPVDISTNEGTVLPHEFVGWVATWLLHNGLLKEWELDIVLANELLDFFRCSWLLFTKLIAWNCVDFQALSIVLVVDCFQLLVVAISQTSFSCNVNKQHGLLTFSMFSDLAQTVAVDVIYRIT